MASPSTTNPHRFRDVWNTTPAWRFPFHQFELSPLSPATATMLESFGPGETTGVGGYVFAHDIV